LCSTGILACAVSVLFFRLPFRNVTRHIIVYAVSTLQKMVSFGTMPLYAGAPSVLRQQLEQIRDRHAVRVVPIGTLTIAQITAINVTRADERLRPIIEEVVFFGRHIYKRRIVNDGYTIEDVIEQISSVMESVSVVLADLAPMTIIENPNPRADRYGNFVRDRAVFECSARHPRPELFSVIPKGDANKPLK
jgi:hypothetical protein